MRWTMFWKTTRKDDKGKMKEKIWRRRRRMTRKGREMDGKTESGFTKDCS